MERLTFCVPCLFGLESVLSYEIKAIGGENLIVTDGKIVFEADAQMIARANLWLRTAERVLVVLGSFEATSFTELFDQTAELPFERFIGEKDAFPVKGWSLNSKLFSVSDCQAIIKKAAVKRLSERYHVSWFEETGSTYQIQFSILKDQVMVMLDTSGIGLHKRGYRKNANEAPIKETLAAGIVDLARVRADSVVCDPMCGSGTFLIEAAMKALQIAPGLRRHFSAEHWNVLSAQDWKNARSEAFEKVRRDATFRAFGADLSQENVELTVDNLRQAGVIARVKVEQGDVRHFEPQGDRPIVIVNPPYGERLLEIKEAEVLYQEMGKAFLQHPQASYYIISPHDQFEELFGKKADKRRKLYNGMIKCQLFMYFKK